jgi:2-oxoacid:acceptor oxidoreductase gamma subunit (pyruvate/2-ketoisovalerate family)/2-oxoacid:acceptor oxidoreductase delta subunit (pyruvate/2-ketoisovalerate family)
MGDMKEMVLLGRGGEGVVLASQILADTFARAGFWVQSFPEFKAERRGAPISAFLRWDETSRIRRRYKVHDCDVLVAISPSPPSPQLLRSVREGGLVILNREERFPRTGPFDIVRVPASRIAQDFGIVSAEGRPMGNLAVLGAAVKTLLPDGLTFLEEAIVSRMRGALAEANVAAARAGFARCTRQPRLAGDAGLEPAEEERERFVLPEFPVSTEAGELNPTGTWSLDRPVLFEACNCCALCAPFCPEGAISRVDGVMEIDYLHCKGCGICEVVCPVRNAIAMEEIRA